MMTKLPELDDIVFSIEHMDGDKLSQENLQSLLEQMPTSDEMAQINAAKNADIPFDKPEKFAVKLTSIPKVQERIKCWIFMQGFEERKKEIFVPLCRVKSACYQLKAYEPLKAILGTILTFGNYLNGGSARGQADGFIFAVLPKLADTKSVFDKNTTLLSFLVKHIYAYRPTLLAMGALPELAEAGKITLAEVEGALNQLGADLRGNKAIATAVAESLKGKDKIFGDTMIPFMEEAERTFMHLEVLFKETGALFLDLCLWSGWPEAKAKAITNDKYFGDLHLFMDAFITLWKVEEAVEERKNFERMMEKKARLEALSGDKKRDKDNKGDKSNANNNTNGTKNNGAITEKGGEGLRKEIGSPTMEGPKANLKKKFGKTAATLRK